MIRRPLLQLLRNHRRTGIGNCGGEIRSSPSTAHPCSKQFSGRHDRGRGWTPIAPRSTSSYQSHRSRLGDRRGDREGGQRGYRESAGHRENRRFDDFSARSPYVSHLEERARKHIRLYPSGRPFALLAPWHRTTVELIMLMSKAWGRNHRSDQELICKFAPLANELLIKVLHVRKLELDGISEKSNIASFSNDDNFPNRCGTIQKQQNARKLGGRQTRVEKQNTEILCQAVTLGWSRCDPKVATDAAQRAQKILDLLEDVCVALGKLTSDAVVGFNMNDVEPSIKLYNHVLCCWSRSLDPDAEVRARALLERMGRPEGAFRRPDTISYNNLLNLHAARGDVAAAEALLEEMERPVNAASSVDVYSYTIVMNAFQRRFSSSLPFERDMKDPERVEGLLSRLVARYEDSGFADAKLRPSNVTFGTAISVYAQADRMMRKDERRTSVTRNWRATDARDAGGRGTTKGMGWGAENAERVLDWIVGLSERERRSKTVTSNDGSASQNKDGGVDYDMEVIRPNAHNFVTVMDAWAKAGRGLEGAERCERLLNRIVLLHRRLGDNELRPSTLCFGALIDAWAKADDKYETAERAESLLDRMEELFLHRNPSNPREVLSNIPYNLVIDAWSRRSGDDVVERAENILRRLDSNYLRTKNRLLRPDVISYTGVIKSYVKHPNGGEKALKLLEKMNNEYNSGNAKARPDGQALAVVMDACAKNARTKDAERILNDLDDSKKNRVMFNTIISGYKKEGRGKEAEAVLKRMIDLSDNEGWKGCSPDVLSFSLCIEAWGNSASPDRISRMRALLDESIERYRSGDKNCKLSNTTFNAVAENIASSDIPERDAHVLALFEKMEDMGCKPSLISFNILIKSCGFARRNKKNALHIAASAFNSLSSAGLRADSITYIAMIHAIINLMEGNAEKEKTMADIFRQCCDDGCLNQHIIDLLLAGAKSEEDFLSMIGVPSSEKVPDIGSLPLEWSERSSKNSTSMKRD